MVCVFFNLFHVGCLLTFLSSFLKKKKKQLSLQKITNIYKSKQKNIMNIHVLNLPVSTSNNSWFIFTVHSLSHSLLCFPDYFETNLKYHIITSVNISLCISETVVLSLRSPYQQMQHHLGTHLKCKFFSSVQSLSFVWLFAMLWTAVLQASLSTTNSQSLLKLISIEAVMPSNHFILSRLLFPLLPIFPSIRVFSSESVLRIRWPKYWSFSFSISPSNEYSGLISFRIDRLDLLVVQGTLKSLLQHHRSTDSKALGVGFQQCFVLFY